MFSDPSAPIVPLFLTSLLGYIPPDTEVLLFVAIIRGDILNSVSQKCSFLGSFSSQSAHNRVLLSLQMLVKWILQGISSGAEIRDEENHPCISIACAQ